jgi:hypothetical protein
VCSETNGDHIGVVSFERLVEALAHAADRPPAD